MKRADQDALTGAFCYSLGAVLAPLTIGLTTGLLDGFRNPDTAWLGRRFVSLLPYGVVCAASLGVIAARFHRRWLGLGPEARPAPSVMLLAVIRAFVLFPLFGLLTLLTVLFELSRTVLAAAFRRFVPGTAIDSRPDAFGERVGRLLPLWFMLAPFQHLDQENPGLAPSQALPVMRRRSARFLPFVLLGVALWTGAVSEDTDDRVDPFWLAAVATGWIGDYLLVMALDTTPAARRAR